MFNIYPAIKFGEKMNSSFGEWFFLFKFLKMVCKSLQRGKWMIFCILLLACYCFRRQWEILKYAGEKEEWRGTHSILKVIFKKKVVVSVQTLWNFQELKT